MRTKVASVWWRPGELAKLDRAARIRGQSRSDFVRAASLTAAATVIAEQRAIVRVPYPRQHAVAVLNELEGAST